MYNFPTPHALADSVKSGDERRVAEFLEQVSKTFHKDWEGGNSHMSIQTSGISEKILNLARQELKRAGWSTANYTFPWNYTRVLIIKPFISDEDDVKFQESHEAGQ
jgi:hypothetical protein